MTVKITCQYEENHTPAFLCFHDLHNITFIINATCFLVNI